MCGGTIDKLVKKSHKVFVTYFTCNDQAFFGNETQEKRRKRAINEVIKSSKLLYYETNFLHFQDIQVEKDKGLLIQSAIKEIRRVEPDVIITHHDHDKHIDHRTLGSIIAEANFQSGCKLCGGNKKWKADLVFNGEVDLEMTTPFDFQVVSAITADNLKNKIRAFTCYESVSDEHKTNKNWLIKKITVCAELRGRSIDHHYGEAFRINSYSPVNINGIKRSLEILS